MGQGRSPCCAKIGLNKGSWTPEEDMRLIAYIQKHGHGNWRALPRLAGLLRCGKSCRLRWINYLRPDIKRGNFTKDEEDTIIKLHGLLGNKWSKIASLLPGRTDNEIKNVWNTHLKKRLEAKKERKSSSKSDPQKSEESPSSPSSATTASMSCSDEGESKAEKETDKIEIPIEPSLEYSWDDMLPDSRLTGVGLNSDKSNDTLRDSHFIDVGLNSDKSSDMLLDSYLTDVGLNSGNSVLDLPEIPIEPEIWNMLTRDEKSDDHQTNCTNLEAETSGGDESERWLADLEKELDLWGDHEKQMHVEAGDPVASYFHALQLSSPSTLGSFY